MSFSIRSVHLLCWGLLVHLAIPAFALRYCCLIHIFGAFSCALRSPFLRLVYCFNSFSARCRSVSLGRVARSFASDVFAVGISCRSSGFSWPFTRSDLPRDDVAPGLRWRLLSSFGCYWPFTISASRAGLFAPASRDVFVVIRASPAARGEGAAALSTGPFRLCGSW